MNRAGHYAAAERLVEEAAQMTREPQTQPQSLRRIARDEAQLLLRAALIHATLATAPADVETAAARPVPGPHLHDATRGARA